nr:HNH endonuclease [Streptomyces sp. NRRL F-5053]
MPRSPSGPRCSATSCTPCCICTSRRPCTPTSPPTRAWTRCRGSRSRPRRNGPGCGVWSATPRAAAALRRRVLDAYGRRCAFCGFDGALDRRPVGLEAAHVRWWAHRGPDVPANTLCLCALHHRLFDKGVLGVDERARIAVSPRFTARGTAARAQVDALGGRPVAVPEDGSEPVAPQYARWHARQVFRA